ncbi:MAG TPA: hypothetical protein VF043_24615 [Ktedonobacteraceae bacterium]
MATQCTRCGKVLPRGDARFCNDCGASFPVSQEEISPSYADGGVPAVGQAAGNSSQSQPGSSSTAGPLQPPNDEKTSHSGSRPAIREQIAYQMPSRPSKRPANDEPPTWMKQLERGVNNAKAPTNPVTRNAAISTNSWSGIEDSTRAANKESNPGGGAQAPEQFAFPSPEVVYPVRPAEGSPPRELRVKVWQTQGESDDKRLPEKEASINGGDIYQTQGGRQEHSSGPMDSDTIEDLPTAHLPAEHIPGNSRDVPSMPTREASSSPRGATPVIMPSNFDEVEQLSTRPMVSQGRAGARPMSSTTGDFVQRHEGVAREMVQPVQRPVVQKPVSSLPFSQAEVQSQRNTPLPSVAVAPLLARSRKKSRRPLVFILVLLGLLLVGGLSAWIVVYQPFTVPAVTNTDQPFQNNALRISLHYPQGWAAHIDQKNGSVSFFDSSHTGQVTVVATDANGSIDQYIKNEAAQLGMTGQAKQSSLTFAGASWQQIQGSVVRNGATYTAILLATEHNSRFYAFVSMAPPAAYNGEEQLVFSHMRSSFQFLS